MTDKWRPIGAFIMPFVDMRFVLKRRIGNDNAPPPPVLRCVPIPADTDTDPDPPTARETG